MKTLIFETKQEMGEAAAGEGARLMQHAIHEKGRANIILATGASQFEMFESLVQQDVDWSRVVMFHLDEYVDIPDTHPASFRKYLKERFVDKLPSLEAFHFVEGDKPSSSEECARIGGIIAAHPIDVAMVGIGENGHLAFNDPPADFDCEEPYIVVKLDEACRRQQLGEGWFASLDDVPAEAISMSIRHIMKSSNIVCTVPDERKAVAVRDALEGPLTNLCPASILRTHPSCRMLLDSPAASLLPKKPE